MTVATSPIDRTVFSQAYAAGLREYVSGSGEAALKIAETGHLTFGTLHTNSAAQTINRIIDIFPANQQSQIRLR